MTIRIAEHMTAPRHVQDPFEDAAYLIQSAARITLAHADTEAEALEAKRAFEQVLLPRFTRDEAIAIVRKRIASPAGVIQDGAFTAGVRATLEALAAAGVFVDDPGLDTCSVGRYGEMADKLDAAGIK